MTTQFEPLIEDEYHDSPNKRTLEVILRKRRDGRRAVGTYCAYAPGELIRAMDAIPVSLCAYSESTIAAAEQVLPANLCPLIKSSYGFIVTDSCPFFAVADAVIAETTCDGKKKMFELISHSKPMHVMDLPQLPDEPEAVPAWTGMIRKLKGFLEGTFATPISDARIEAEIRATNRKNRLMGRIFAYAALRPSVLGWSEMYDVISLANAYDADELDALAEVLVAKLERRAASGLGLGAPGAPRVLVGGCPVGGDSAKVFRILEQAGGVVVALDSCSGMKPFSMVIEEGTGDPVAALARAYLTIPCACMSPNIRRLEHLDRMIERYRPDVVVDVVLQACHAYNIESSRIREHAQGRHGLPFLKIETDYSNADAERIRTRVEALFESR
ncbi:MAG: double-cubane-cluster-containing anaerobic reductase [Holophaga sp.]|nr:double-cubane-cluster-containing anaerobic reductase [Holophaga sp.]